MSQNQLTTAYLPRTMNLLTWHFTKRFFFCFLFILPLLANARSDRFHHVDLNAAEIRGTVIEEGTGSPVAGATVLVKGLGITAVTDSTGSFFINLLTTKGTFVVTHVNFEEKEMAFNGTGPFTITMTSKVAVGEEVIVIGYGTQNRKDISSSVASVKGDALVKSTSPNVSNAISGKIAGVIARQADGRPGASTSFNIRGMGDALYVVDGVPRDQGHFNNINMDDIEDIVALKDGAATAIWGVGAANGVVLVTTKRGRKNLKPLINFNGYYGGQDWTRFPKTANAAQYYEGQIEADVNQWLANPNRTGTAPTYTISKEEFEKWKAGTDPNYQGFDWSSYIQRYAPIRSGSLNVSGGGENVSYHIGLGNLKQDGAIKNFMFQRTNLQSNVDINTSKNFKIGFSINGRLEQRKNPGEPGGDDIAQPMAALYRNIPIERPYANNDPRYPANNGPRVSYNFALLDYDQTGFLEDTWRVFQGNVYAEYKTPIKGLVAKVTANYYYADHALDIHEFTYKTYSYNNATNVFTEFNTNANPYREKLNGFTEEKIYQGYLNYNGAFGKHVTSATAGVESNERREGSTNLFRGNPSTNFIRLIRTSELRDIDDRLLERGVLSFFGRVNYTYDNRYLFGVALRQDKSSAFQNALAAKFFPGFSAAWNAHNEAFLKPVFSKALSSFKLRGSYANAGLVDYGIAGSYIPGYTFPSGGYVFGDNFVNGTSFRENPSLAITWTDSKYLNAGVDIGFFKDKLMITADVFSRKQTGQLAQRTDVLIPVEIAQTLPQENLNATQTLGVDGAITYSNRVGDFSYAVAVNGVFARSRALIRYRQDINFGSAWDEYRNSTVNRWTAAGWGYFADGQFQNMDEIRNHKIDQDGQGNITLLPGDVRYKDLNGDGIMTALDLRPLGVSTGLPLFNYGINLSGAWKSIDLTLNFQGAGGYYFLMAEELQRPFLNNGNIPSLLLDRWHRKDPYDPNSDWIPGKYPSIRRNGISNNLSASTFNTTNVQYLRLRNFEIGYTLPGRILSKVGINKVRFYVNSYNTFTLTNIDVIDPELSAGGGVQYPQTKMWTFGLNVTF